MSTSPAPLDLDAGDTTTVEGVLDIVRRHGGRITSSRRLLLRALFDAKGHHTAEDLAAEVQKQAPDIHLSTALFGGLANEATARFGFTIDPHHFAMLGRCADCS